ncbi:Fic family protein [Bartonella sp. AR 15-3]|uniref:Fic/DOC family protein n=1 Tax=Bartonella sp. AR 15-3 TaxID=545617 RepID=UPI00099AEBAD|nr:Fic family protein [Bartonella sp. AR 15-3]OPB32498.1 Fido, protein-threonine AMPylation domain-containing protein [Bartonella sp. AR 15-3]
MDNKAEALVSFRHYNYPNSFTLKNKYHIRNYERLELICIHRSTQEIINLHKEAMPEQFDSFYLKYIHRRLFYKIFEWAGCTRDIPFMFLDGTVACQPEIKKVVSNTFFAIGEQVQTGLKKFDKILAEKNNLQGLSPKEFTNEAAELFSFLNYIRPFKKGNRRAQCFFFQKLAEAAGYTLDFSIIREDHMLSASISALRDNDLQPMQSIFKKILVQRPPRIAYNRRSLKNPEYNNCSRMC